MREEGAVFGAFFLSRSCTLLSFQSYLWLIAVWQCWKVGGMGNIFSWCLEDAGKRNLLFGVGEMTMYELG